MKKVVLIDTEYNVIKDDSDCFDFEEVNNLITDYFKPFDYVFGDYSYGKLRLKGFYADNNKKKHPKKPRHSWASRDSEYPDPSGHAA